MNILLIGPRGCGKSTLGSALAARVRRPFIDTDQRVLERFGESSVARVWAIHGEMAWRNAEVQCLREALLTDGQIISLGGGVPMISQARTLLESARRDGLAKVVYLKCRPNTLMERLRRDAGDRPPLTDLPMEQEVASTVATREPTYLALADAVIAADGPADEVLNLMVAELAKMG